MQNNFTETHEFLVSIIGNVPYGIIAVDMEGYIIMCNEKALAHLNIEKTVNEALETYFTDYLAELPSFRNILENRLISGRKAFDLNAIPFHENYLTIKSRRILNGMIITIEDVTYSKELENFNLNAMLKGQESERRRLAKEIHDGIGPLMSTIKLHLDTVQSELEDVPPKVLKKINSMGELIHEVADDIRNISHALMPSALIDLGLVAALDNLCQKANDSGKIQVNFYHSGMENRIEQNMALGIFRITQELLNNAFKYAQANIINIQLIKHPESIMLMVEDDGIGFDKNRLKDQIGNGIGLRNIQTRAKTLGGHFNLDTQVGKGVLATVEIPLH